MSPIQANYPLYVMKPEKDIAVRKSRKIIGEISLLITGIIIALFIGYEFMQKHMVAFFQSLMLSMFCLLLTGCYWLSSQLPFTQI